MDLVPVDAPDDPRVADYALISDAVLVRERGLFVAEGRLLVKRLIADRRYVVRSVLLSDAAHRDMKAHLTGLEPAVPVYVCRADFFRSLTGFHIHRGCLALAERPSVQLASDLLRTGRTILILEAIANPDNVGGIFRNAGAFGADAVLMDAATCDPLYRKAIRTSMGATLRVAHARIADWPGGLLEAREAGYRLVALTPREPARTLEAFASEAGRERVALLIGNEGTGLSAAAASWADDRVRIPITADVDSLNVAVATGIALSRLTTIAHL